MRFLFVLILLLNISCIQNIMECPVDVVTLKKDCSASEDRAKSSQSSVLLGLGIATVGYSSLSSEPSSVSGITSEHNRLRAAENASLPDLVWVQQSPPMHLKK